MRKLTGLILMVLIIGACSWVKLTPYGEKVRVLSLEEVTSCKKLGKTTTRLKDKVAGVKRDKKTVKKEMETLARNSAADLDGDTVVAISEIKDGKQEFEVYRCVNP